MERITYALKMLNDIKNSLVTHCKNSNLKDNPIELNAVLRAYNDMFDTVAYELNEYDKHSDLVWDIQRGNVVVVDKEIHNSMIQLNEIFKKCFKVDGKNNSFIICGTPDPVELKLLLDNGFKEVK